MDLIIGIISGILFLLLLILLLSYITFRMTFLSIKEKHIKLYDGLDGEMTELKLKSRELIDKLKSYNYEDVYIDSYDGLKLHARYYHISDNAPLQIQFHGYKSSSGRDFSGGGTECLKRGHNLLLVDQRAHGESEGRVITFGIKERYDVLSFINYAINRIGKDTKIILCGISMGAATVLMSTELPLPENVVGILADCPYSSPAEIIKKVCRDMRIPPRLAFPFIRLGGLIFGRFDICALSAKETVTKTDIPILLIHGSGDDFVPVEMSDELARLGKNITYLRVENATHGLSFIYDNDAYLEALSSFISKIFFEAGEKANENQ